MNIEEDIEGVYFFVFNSEDEDIEYYFVNCCGKDVGLNLIQ